jgi:dTDP-4-amino-4,6-dideoxygalactose transaminase
MVRRLEALFAAVTGVPHAVAVNSGTTALVAALQVLDLVPGDEVITSPFTFVATLNAILHAGATVRFADVSTRDFCVDPDLVETGDRTRVLMPVHLYGQPADMGRLARLATRAGVTIVEDAAQAVGAAFDGTPVGGYGLGCFSLYATKNVTTGEGGVITTSDAGLADRLRLLRNQGMRQRYSYELPGHNYRMTDLHAAVGIPQLTRLADINDTRARNAERLTKHLAGLPGLVVPTALPGRTHVWHQYTIRVTEQARVSRDELAARLAKLGVATGVFYPRLAFDHDCYREHPRVVAGETPVARSLTKQVLSLPVHPALTEADLDAIVDAVGSVLA